MSSPLYVNISRESIDKNTILKSDWIETSWGGREIWVVQNEQNSLQIVHATDSLLGRLCSFINELCKSFHMNPLFQNPLKAHIHSLPHISDLTLGKEEITRIKTTLRSNISSIEKQQSLISQLETIAKIHSLACSVILSEETRFQEELKDSTDQPEQDISQFNHQPDTNGSDDEKSETDSPVSQEHELLLTMPSIVNDESTLDIYTQNCLMITPTVLNEEIEDEREPIEEEVEEEIKLITPRIEQESELEYHDDLQLSLSYIEEPFLLSTNEGILEKKLLQAPKAIAYIDPISIPASVIALLKELPEQTTQELSVFLEESADEEMIFEKKLLQAPIAIAYIDPISIPATEIALLKELPEQTIQELSLCLDEATDNELLNHQPLNEPIENVETFSVEELNRQNLLTLARQRIDKVLSSLSTQKQALNQLLNKLEKFSEKKFIFERLANQFNQIESNFNHLKDNYQTGKLAFFGLGSQHVANLSLQDVQHYLKDVELQADHFENLFKNDHYAIHKASEAFKNLMREVEKARMFYHKLVNKKPTQAALAYRVRESLLDLHDHLQNFSRSAKNKPDLSDLSDEFSLCTKELNRDCTSIALEKRDLTFIEQFKKIPENSDEATLLKTLFLKDVQKIIQNHRHIIEIEGKRFAKTIKFSINGNPFEIKMSENILNTFKEVANSYPLDIYSKSFKIQSGILFNSSAEIPLNQLTFAQLITYKKTLLKAMKNTENNVRGLLNNRNKLKNGLNEWNKCFFLLKGKCLSDQYLRQVLIEHQAQKMEKLLNTELTSFKELDAFTKMMGNRVSKLRALENHFEEEGVLSLYEQTEILETDITIQKRNPQLLTDLRNAYIAQTVDKRAACLKLLDRFEQNIPNQNSEEKDNHVLLKHINGLKKQIELSKDLIETSLFSKSTYIPISAELTAKQLHEWELQINHLEQEILKMVSNYVNKTHNLDDILTLVS